VNRLVRLNTDGTVDSGFSIGTAANNAIFKVAIQVDGKIVIGGDFATFNTVAKSRMVRLEANGAIDATFDTGAGFGGRVKDFALQTDGKIVAVGGFTTFNAVARLRAARLNSNGSLDTTFDPGVGFTSEVAMVQPLPDGKYLIVGNTFVTALGLPRNRSSDSDRTVRLIRNSLAALDLRVRQQHSGLSSRTTGNTFLAARSTHSTRVHAPASFRSPTRRKHRSTLTATAKQTGRSLDTMAVKVRGRTGSI
ncbi:MAG: hypothetical protein DMF63_10195, partial [Acidobacteria bacterium]